MNKNKSNIRGDVSEIKTGTGAEQYMSEYETAARKFLEKTGATFSAKFLGFFDSAEEWGQENGARVHGEIPVFRVTISTAAGRMSVRFRGSIHDGSQGKSAADVYDVLAALMKTDPGSFDEFAHEFGYFPISSAEEYRHARKVWNACRREYAGVCRVWPSEEDREALFEIQ